MMGVRSSQDRISAKVELDEREVMKLARDTLAKVAAPELEKVFGEAIRDENDLSRKLMQMLPDELWLHQDRNKEGYIYYRHAWGRASVTTDQNGANPYAVDVLVNSVTIDTPGGRDISREQRTHVSYVDADVAYGGTLPVDPNFTAQWYAQATAAGFGTWHIGPEDW
jgi:hypothetical protein